jgi:hypothetical protein
VESAVFLFAFPPDLIFDAYSKHNLDFLQKILMFLKS